MKLTLQEPRFLKDSVMIISELVNDVTFKVNKNMIELVAIDPANVAMVMFKLLSSAFSEYTLENDIEISVSLENFKQILKRAKPSDALTLELDTEKNRLNVMLRGETNRKFDLALLEPREGEQKIPSLDFPVKIETSTLLFNEAIEDMDVISDSLSLVVDSDKLKIQSDGTMSSGEVVITNDQETDIINTLDECVRSKYSTEYLKKIMKGSKLSNTVFLSLGGDYPLKLEYKIMDKLSLAFILAPRVSND